MPAKLREALESYMTVPGLPATRIVPRYTERLFEPGTPFAVLIIDRERLDQMSPGNAVQQRRVVDWRLLLYGPQEQPLDDLLEAVTIQVAGQSGRHSNGTTVRDTERTRVEYALTDTERGVLGWSAAASFTSRVSY